MRDAGGSWARSATSVGGPSVPFPPAPTSDASGVVGGTVLAGTEGLRSGPAKTLRRRVYLSEEGEVPVTEVLRGVQDPE